MKAPEPGRSQIGTTSDEEPLNPLRYARPLIASGLGGRRVFTLLVPDACRYACSFCPMAGERTLPNPLRTTRGLARVFMTAFRRGLCDGLYLTAGVPRNPVRATARMIELLEALRVHHGFRGYVHVKAVPGAGAGQMQKLVRLADRVSTHLEPACGRALLENPTGIRTRGLELFSSPEKAAAELRAAARESARRAPELLPAPGTAESSLRQMSLFISSSSSIPMGSG
jgi:predicted DNA-binding helix-hairpin-helix protein